MLSFLKLNWSTCNSRNLDYSIGIESSLLLKQCPIAGANFEVISFFQIVKNNPPVKIETFMFPANKTMNTNLKSKNIQNKIQILISGFVIY